MERKEKLKKALEVKEKISHSSLILNKYLDKPAGEDKDSSFRNSLMKSAIDSLNNIKNTGIYKRAYNKWKSSLPQNVETTDLETDGSLIVGLGSDNVLETGITLHHTYGVPYIPGSALKGLAAHYCNEVWGSQDENFKREKIVKETEKKVCGDYYKEIFGDNTQAGHIIFWDAWIIPEKLSGCLKKDIMTPHNTKYYSANDNTPPSDYESPNPISFLSVEGVFTIALSCDVPGEAAKKWIDLTFKLLKSALKEWGVGAKTSSGYGRFKVNTGNSTINVSTVTVQNEFEKFKVNFNSNKKYWSQKGQQNQQIIPKIMEIKDVKLQKQAKEYVKTQIKEKEMTDKLKVFLNS